MDPKLVKMCRDTLRDNQHLVASWNIGNPPAADKLVREVLEDNPTLDAEKVKLCVLKLLRREEP